MVTTKHCCYGVCTSDSRYDTKGVWFIGFGNGFPKPEKEREKCIRWVTNCGRRDFTIKNVTKDTYICSLHFVGGNGPTEENPDPVKLGSEVTRSRKRKVPAERKTIVSNLKKEKTNEEEVAEVMVSLSNLITCNPSTSMYTCEPCSPDVPSNNNETPSQYVETATQTEKFVTSENVQLSIEKKLLQNELKLVRSELAIKSSVKKCRKEIFPNEETPLKGSEHNVKFNETLVLSVDSMQHDNKKFRFYTGLTYNQFFCLWQFLGPAAKKLTYWNTDVSNREKTPSKRRGPKRKLTSENQLLLTLVRLRLGLLHTDLAYRFGISTKQVSTIVLTWIQFLFVRFSALRKVMFATRSKIRKHLPKSFKKFRNIRCIIDCTEVRVQQPSNFGAQGNAYSAYKGHTTFKFLVAIAPNGAILFVSDAYEGSISDKEIVKQSGFLDFLEPGDVIMADRGFLIQDVLNERQVKMNMPPFLGGRSKFTPQEESTTKDIAKHRIHVERSIERMKKFRILQKVMPLSLQPVFSQCVFVIGCLVNFQKPLVQ